MHNVNNFKLNENAIDNAPLVVASSPSTSFLGNSILLRANVALPIAVATFSMLAANWKWPLKCNA